MVPIQRPTLDADTHQREIDRCLKALRRKSGPTVNVDDVAAVLEAVAGSFRSVASRRDKTVLSELGSLSTFIRSAKAEISALRPDEVKESFLPKAADELDAIVAATADATNAIMDAAERIDGFSSDLPAASRGALADETGRIFEACGFQDITGQRVSKVVMALKEIEVRVDGLIEAFGGGTGKRPKRAATKAAAKTGGKTARSRKKKPSDQDLLEGPQLAGSGISQDDVDALLARS